MAVNWAFIARDVYDANEAILRDRDARVRVREPEDITQYVLNMQNAETKLKCCY